MFEYQGHGSSGKAGFAILFMLFLADSEVAKLPRNVVQKFLDAAWTRAIAHRSVLLLLRGYQLNKSSNQYKNINHMLYVIVPKYIRVLTTRRLKFYVQYRARRRYV